MEIEKEIERASKQLRSCRKFPGGKVKLSKSEKLKWPFLQPSIDILRADLREAKATLMLMLQVTTLALSKKMADLSASANSEQGDLYRAVIALQQQQQQQQQKSHEAVGGEKRLSDGTKGSLPARFKQGSDSETSSITAKDCPPIFSRSSTPRAAQTSPAAPVFCAMTIPKATERPQNDSESDGLAKENFDTAAAARSKHPMAPLAEEAHSSNVTLPSSESSLDHSGTNTPVSTLDSSSVNDENDGQRNYQDYQSQLKGLEQQNKARLLQEREMQLDSPASPGKSNLPNLPTNVRSELQMFMLKPIVKDFFDKIELSWSIQKPKMPLSVIKNHLAHMEADGVPSIVDMLETLYDHEHSVIDAHQGQGELLSLKRTKTDIQHRDIVFKGVPGLQFVVEPKPELKVSSETNQPPKIEKFMAHLPSVEAGPGENLFNRSKKTEMGKKTSMGDFIQDQSLGWWTDEMDEGGAQSRPVSYHSTEESSFTPQSKKAAPTPNMSTTSFDRQIDSSRKESTMKGSEYSKLSTDLQGMPVNKQGLVIGPEGAPVAKIVEGDSKELVGRVLNSNLQIVDDYGRVIGACELIPHDKREAVVEGPFAGLGPCVVVKTGMVEDQEGNNVGVVVEGDAESLVGYAVCENGDIGDELGQVKGHAEPYEEPDEEAADPPSPNTISSEDEHKRFSSAEYQPNVFKEVKSLVYSTEENRPQEQKLREMEAEMEKAFKQKLAAKESKYKQHEEELRVKELELEKLEWERARLGMEKSFWEQRHSNTNDNAAGANSPRESKSGHNSKTLKNKLEVISLSQKSKQLEIEVEELEGKIIGKKMAAAGSAAPADESLRMRLKLLEDEAKESARIIRETNEKYAICPTFRGSRELMSVMLTSPLLQITTSQYQCRPSPERSTSFGELLRYVKIQV